LFNFSALFLWKGLEAGWNRVDPIGRIKVKVKVLPEVRTCSKRKLCTLMEIPLSLHCEKLFSGWLSKQHAIYKRYKKNRQHKSYAFLPSHGFLRKCVPFVKSPLLSKL
jgi:hypothetical protein